MRARRLIAVAVPLALAAGCTAPDLSSSIQDAQKLLEASIKSSQKPLQKLANAELAAAERAMAATDERIIALPSGCLQMNADLAVSVDHCRIIERAAPVNAPANATQVLLAQDVMLKYFSALLDLNNSTSPANIQSQSTALVSALDTFAKTQNGDALARLGARASEKGPALSAIAGFATEQARISAMRRMVVRADPVLEELVRDIQPVLARAGDKTAATRKAAVDAYAAYNTAKLAGDTQAEVRTAQQAKTAFDALHKAEANSPLRQLYLARDLNAAMLKALQGPASLDDLNKLTAEIAEIVTLLEAN